MKSMKVLVLVFACLVAYVVDARVCPVCPGLNIPGLGLYPKESGVFTAVINSPRDGGRFMKGEGIHFEGVSDESIPTGEWWTYTYSWGSSRDGVLSNTRFFASNSLSHGRHRITFSVTKVDYEGTTSYTSVDNISLIVEPHPLRVRIKSPPPEETYLNSDVNFQALVTGGIGPYTCRWVSSMDGFIGGGMNFSTKLSVGTHEITVTAVDSMGRTAREETFIAVARSAEIPLRISIVSPRGDETYREGDSVNLITSMSGGKKPYVYVWRLGGVVVDKIDAIPSGIHAIDLEVTDANSITVNDSVEITVFEVCIRNGLCELREDYLNCPGDCPSGGMDKYCDKVKDGVCDPDCSRKEDVDCVCNKDNICELGIENYLNCPKDCPSGSSDGYCDKIGDGVCDPDCPRERDPDCATRYMDYLILLIIVLFILIFYMKFIRE